MVKRTLTTVRQCVDPLRITSGALTSRAQNHALEPCAVDNGKDTAAS